jgi:anti-sigma factor RsiW
MGWIGAARLAEAREANLRNSSVYWVGTAVEISSYLVALAGSGQKGRTARLGWDTTFVSMAALGTLLQVVGAHTGPTRAEVETVAARPLGLVPVCAPTSGGLMCGIALAGY